MKTAPTKKLKVYNAREYVRSRGRFIETEIRKRRPAWGSIAVWSQQVMNVARIKAGWLPIIALLFTAAAVAQSSTDAVKQAVAGATQIRALVNDPDSLVFDRIVVRTDKDGAVKTNKQGWAHICYEVRARNGFGGMGSSKFIFDDGRFNLVGSDVQDGVPCKETKDITADVKAVIQ